MEDGPQEADAVDHQGLLLHPLETALFLQQIFPHAAGEMSESGHVVYSTADKFAG